jgi:Uma2 family endonuclease
MDGSRDRCRARPFSIDPAGCDDHRDLDREMIRPRAREPQPGLPGGIGGTGRVNERLAECKISNARKESDLVTPEVLKLATHEGRHPTWEMALIYPDQGGWTVEDYLTLDIGRHVEFSRGFVEFQPMPDEKHQAIVFFLVQALNAYAALTGGRATMAPFPLRLREEKFREPDVLFMKGEHLDRCQRRFWQGVDLVIEVLSDSNRTLDLETKRAEYARAGIPEYWIVDPEQGTVTVLVLAGEGYSVHGVHARGQTAVSVTLAGFQVDGAAVLDAD